jgi:hypothetical protein
VPRWRTGPREISEKSQVPSGEVPMAAAPILMGLELMGLSMKAGRGRGLGGAREIGGEKQSPASVRPGKPREGENEPHEDVDREGRETGRRKAGDGQQPERGPAPPGASQGAEQDDAAADDK